MAEVRKHIAAYPCQCVVFNIYHWLCAVIKLMYHCTERWWPNLILIWFVGRKLLKEDHHNLDYTPSIVGIRSNRVRSMSWSFKLLCFVYPCQLVIEFEGCDMFPWRLCLPVPCPPPCTANSDESSSEHKLPTDRLTTSCSRISRGRFQSHHMVYLFIFLDHVVHEWVYFVCGGGGGHLWKETDL